MGKIGWVTWGLLVLLCCAAPVSAADPVVPPPPPPPTKEKEAIDMQNQETYIDVSDALRSKQYVHRAILNSLVRETNRFAVGHLYISHMMGFNQIYQRNSQAYSKFSSGLQGVSIGYVTPWGHGLEVGGEISAVSNVFVSYKYFLRPAHFSLWGTFGGGVGTEVGTDFAEGPPEAQTYTGPKNMAFVSLGLLVPTIDVGFKVETRLNFYGWERTIFTSGLGLILFL
jgi:hypothetical protein